MVSSKKKKKNVRKKPVKKPVKRSSKKKPVAKKPVKKTRRTKKKIGLRELEKEFEKILAQQRELQLENLKLKGQLKKVRDEVVEMFARPAENREQRERRLRISFQLEAENLLPRRGQTKKQALEEWATRNGWSSAEMWAEYRRNHPRYTMAA